jgi:hypothetical protein
VPQPIAGAIVKPADQQAADRARDAAWIEQGLTVVREVASGQTYLTVDDVRLALRAKPRRSSLMSALIIAAAREGVIEQTGAHRPSVRSVNGGRTVRVWKSLTCEIEGAGR